MAASSSQLSTLRVGSAQPNELNLHLHEKQGVAYDSPATEILYGGAAGGGKSYMMRIAAILWCTMVPGLQVYLFRRIREDLVKNHMEGPKGFHTLLAGWVQLGWVRIVEDEIEFWNGAKIYLCHCKDEKDRFKYLGAEIHVLLIDELTTFTEVIYRFLRNRVRAVGLNLPPALKDMFPRILCGSNPGNIGHLWVKRAFVDPGPLRIRQMDDGEGGMLRQYIPAVLEDNPSMAREDPGYERRLQGLGSAALVKAMRYGDWNVIEGAFFDCWETHKHVIEPFDVPAEWARNCSGDWGSASPFSFGWWGIVPDLFKTPSGMWLPRGCLVRYREWYGVQRNEDGTVKENKGIKLHAEKVGEGLRDIESKMPKMGRRVLDPSAFKEDGGPSIAERIYRGSGNVIKFMRADNARVAGRGAMGGWDQMRSRLVGDDEGRPLIVCFDTCTDSIRTIPALQHDSDKPEDLDTTGEDHAGDDWRYECMSRPVARRGEQPDPPPDMRGIRDMNFNELLDSQPVSRPDRI